MKNEIDDMISEIRRGALQVADDRAGRLMIYSEMELGAISACLFYLTSEGIIRYRSCSHDFVYYIYDFWKAWRAEPGKREWRTMTMVMNDDRWTTDMKYPDELNPSDSVMQRRPAAITSVFGNMAVDYSRPE